MFSPAPSKGWCLNPEGLLNGTLYHPFGTLWKVQVGKYIPVPFEYLRAMASKKKNNQRCSRRELPTRGATIGRGLGWNSSQGEAWKPWRSLKRQSVTRTNSPQRLEDVSPVKDGDVPPSCFFSLGGRCWNLYQTNISYCFFCLSWICFFGDFYGFYHGIHHHFHHQLGLSWICFISSNHLKQQRQEIRWCSKLKEESSVLSMFRKRLFH